MEQNNFSEKLTVAHYIRKFPCVMFQPSASVQEEFFLNCLTLEDGTVRLSRNFGN